MNDGVLTVPRRLTGITGTSVEFRRWHDARLAHSPEIDVWDNEGGLCDLNAKTNSRRLCDVWARLLFFSPVEAAFAREGKQAKENVQGPTHIDQMYTVTRGCFVETARTDVNRCVEGSNEHSWSS